MHRRPTAHPSESDKMKVIETKVIGKGAYGAAVLCKDKKSGDNLVKKQIKCRSYREVREAKQEAKYLEDLKSTNVIGYKAIEQKNDREVNIFMEYADGGDLGQEIEKRAKRRNHYTEGELLDRFADCIKAVDKMHSKGVVHRDIKPANIFLNKEGQAKVGDFGIARSCSKNGRVRTPIGTPLYLDPQRCSNREYGQKADMWSLGCVLYEMATLRPAFDARSMPELKRKVAAGRVDMSKIPANYDPSIKQIIGDMLQVREDRRSSVQDVMKHQKIRGAVKRRSSSNTASDNETDGDGGDAPSVSQPPALEPIPGSPSLKPKSDARTPLEPIPPSQPRGRAEQLRGDARIRARSQSPFSGQVRGRPASGARIGSARGARHRSLSPSVRNVPERRGGGAKGPSPLVANSNDSPAERRFPCRKELTPEHPEVSHAIKDVMAGKRPSRAINRALDQMNAHNNNRRKPPPQWGFPPIHA